MRAESFVVWIGKAGILCVLASACAAPAAERGTRADVTAPAPPLQEGVAMGDATPSSTPSSDDPKLGDDIADRVRVHQGAFQVNGRLAPERIRAAAEAHWIRFRRCYERGLATDGALEGRVVVKFVIEKLGSVVQAEDGGSDFRDPNVVRCVVDVIRTISFPRAEGSFVTVVYPIVFLLEEPSARVRLEATRVKNFSEMIAEHLARHELDALRTCYGETLRRTPALRGRLTLSVNISDDSYAVEIKESDIRDAGLRDCALRRFRGVHFGKEQGSGATNIEYVLAFEPARRP